MVLRSIVHAGAVLLLLTWGAADAAAWCVRGVAGWDTLRMRAGPSPEAREVGRIAPAACGVAIIGRCRGAWCPVQWQGRAGWSNATYLTRGGLLDMLATASIIGPPTLIEPPPPRRLARAPSPGRTRAAQKARAPAVHRAGTPVRVARPKARPPSRIAALNPPARPPVARAMPAAPPPPSALRPTGPGAPTEARVAPPVPAAAGTASPSLVAPAAAAAAITPRTPPQNDGQRDTCIQDVAKGDTLKVRAGPGNDHALRYGYPAGICGVRITGACSNGWCPVDFRGYRGWAEQRFLK